MSGSTIKLDNGEYAMRVAVLQSPTADGNDGGQATGAGTVSAGVQRVVQGGASTATQTSVASATTAGGVTILAAAAGRMGGTITNTDANALYLYFGANGTVSASVYNVQLLTGQTLYLDPGGYSGAISGIWAADGSGSAYVCEFTT